MPRDDGSLFCFTLSVDLNDRVKAPLTVLLCSINVSKVDAWLRSVSWISNQMPRVRTAIFMKRKTSYRRMRRKAVGQKKHLSASSIQDLRVLADQIGNIIPATAFGIGRDAQET